MPTVPRSMAARELMAMRWHHPVYRPSGAEIPRAGTGVETPRVALAQSNAFASLVENDPRPLLVLRECATCNRAEDVLLSRSEANERTLILARFFRCVKLPADVVKDEHPFHAVFPKIDGEHLFVCARDGSNRKPLLAETSRVQLWSAMESTIAAAYGIDAAKVAKQILTAIDRTDECERKVVELEARLGKLTESPGVEPGKAQEVRDQLALAKADAAKNRAAVEALFAIRPKPTAAVGAER